MRSTFWIGMLSGICLTLVALLMMEHGSPHAYAQREPRASYTSRTVIDATDEADIQGSIGRYEIETWASSYNSMTYGYYVLDTATGRVVARGR